MPLALPFTHNYVRTVFIVQQRKPQAHELKLRISLPEELMAWGWVVIASEISSDFRNQSDRFPQEPGRLQPFFFA